MATFITYFSQKGGCGKTTLTAVTASYLAYKLGKKVLVLDADKQHSFHSMRRNDMASLEHASDDDYIKKAMKSLSLTEDMFYDVEACSIAEAIGRMGEEVASDRYDYVLIDLPGTVDDSEIFKCVLLSDYVIIPLDHSAVALESSLKSALVVAKKLKPLAGCRIKKLGGVFNMVPSTQRTKLFSYVNALSKVGFDHMFSAVIGRADRPDKPEQTSTILPPSEEMLRQDGCKVNLGGYLRELTDSFLK